MLHSFEYGNCDIWYMRFAVSPNFETLAAGNQIGKVIIIILIIIIIIVIRNETKHCTYIPPICNNKLN